MRYEPSKLAYFLETLDENPEYAHRINGVWEISDECPPDLAEFLNFRNECYKIQDEFAKNLRKVIEDERKASYNSK